MAKRYYWLKLKEDFFKNKEMKKLRTIAGGDTFTIIYLKMQLLSLKNEGKILFEAVEDNFAAELALELDEKIENVQITLEFLKTRNLITETFKDEYSLIEAIGSIGTEGDSAERVRKYREQKSLQCNNNALHCNSCVTNCNTEIEIEKEKEKKKESKKKESLKVGFLSASLNSDEFFYLQDDNFKKNFVDYLEMRRVIKKSAALESAQRQILKQLHEYTISEATEMLGQLIANNWIGLKWTDIYQQRNKKGENYANYQHDNQQFNKQQFKAGSVASAFAITQSMREWNEKNNTE